ncbi:MAG: ComEC/Rec2-related protein, partial [Frankiales bacterium]|nr:ComEC/Rec2-related protein [Frankiales bacterium]
MNGRPSEDLDLRLAPAALAAWLVAWQVRAAPPRTVVLAAVVLAAVGLAVLVRSPRRSAAGVAAILLCAAAAATCTAGRVASRTAGPVPGLASRGAAVSVTAVLTDDPRQAGAQPGGRPLVVARLRVDRLTSAGRSYHLRAPVLVLATERSWLGLLPGQRLHAEGRLRAPEPGDDVAAVLSGRGAPLLLGRPGVLQ